jgi:beta-glucosidase
MFLLGVATLGTSAQQASIPAYLDVTRPIEERVEDALSRLTLEEKVAMCHAQSKFSAPGVARLGIPEIWTSDGPHGIRAEVKWDAWTQAGWTNDSCTAFPALTCLAASFDPSLSQLYGKSIGEEARYRNKNILLAPGVNIARTPLNGRNFEYMGEDPYLASQMVVPYIQGVQSNGVAACVKHFALNDQENNRHNVDVQVDDRALYEIYLPAFRAAVVDGKVWSIMGSYNLYNGQWACQNKRLLTTILRDEWGFDGVALTDWGGVNNTEQALYSGLDMEFGTHTDGLSSGAKNAYDRFYFAQPLLKLIKNGKVSETEVDKKVRNILRLIMRTTMAASRPYGSFASPEHFATARHIAESGIVLLKNEGNLLPISNGTKRVLVVGENAIKMMTVGGGSSSLKAKHESLPLDALRARLAAQGIDVDYARGYVGSNVSSYTGVSTGQDLKDTRSAAELIAEAVEMARKADIVVFFGGLNKSTNQDAEGDDRLEYGLPYGQDSVITALAKANPQLVVVNLSGGAVAMPWLSKVPTVVQTWYNGSEAGPAIASILTGDVNPSGKLPFTIAARLNDFGAHASGDALSYPGLDNKEVYQEGLYVGYRYTDKKGIKPLFPFGHGLSYTTFSYGKPTVTKQDGKVIVELDVKNTGKREGAEVVQLYVSDKTGTIDRPIKELKGFQKVTIEPGATTHVTITLDDTSFSYFDADAHKWVCPQGKFELLIGSSSSDIRRRIDIQI